MPIGSYDDIVEVQVTSAPNANRLLESGYILLGIHAISSLRHDNGGTPYVQQGVTFIVGRDQSTKHFDIPRAT